MDLVNGVTTCKVACTDCSIRVLACYFKLKSQRFNHLWKDWIHPPSKTVGSSWKMAIHQNYCIENFTSASQMV